MTMIWVSHVSHMPVWSDFFGIETTPVMMDLSREEAWSGVWCQCSNGEPAKSLETHGISCL